ncbi:MAG: DUF6476 family protein [Alphaproteobacteria bacterium]
MSQPKRMSPAGLRAIKFAVYAMAALIVAGMVTIIVTLFNRASRWGESDEPESPPAVETVRQRLELAEGDRIASASLDGDRLLLVIDRAGGHQDVLVIDARSGIVALDLTGGGLDQGEQP